jgi:hypothetical protein
MRLFAAPLDDAQSLALLDKAGWFRSFVTDHSNS